MREEVSVDMDSFDYGFYMYGLQHYGNMPLIEENEFREAKKDRRTCYCNRYFGLLQGKTCAAVFE